jgi:hypothetical protein
MDFLEDVSYAQAVIQAIFAKPCFRLRKPAASVLGFWVGFKQIKMEASIT